MITASEIPVGLSEQAALGPLWVDWLSRLPGAVSALLDEWGLRRDGDELWHGFESLVVPVLDRQGARAVLKVAFDGDDEGAQEALGLQHWHGRGSVRMLRADPRRRAILLERLTRRDLTTVDDDEACRVVAGLYGRLHVPAPGRLALLTTHLERWLDNLAGIPRDAPVPRRFVEQALSVGRDFLADTATVGVIVHGDLHHDNVLDFGPRGWLAVDPKGLIGERGFDYANIFTNPDLARAEPPVAVRPERFLRRLDIVTEAAGLDRRRLLMWIVAWCGLSAAWFAEDGADMSIDLRVADLAAAELDRMGQG